MRRKVGVKGEGRKKEGGKEGRTEGRRRESTSAARL